MAKDLARVPITTTTSKYAFNIGSNILNKYKNCLLPKSVEAIICNFTWKHKFRDLDDDVNIDEDGNIEKRSSSNATSINLEMENDKKKMIMKLIVNFLSCEKNDLICEMTDIVLLDFLENSNVGMFA